MFHFNKTDLQRPSSTPRSPKRLEWICEFEAKKSETRTPESIFWSQQKYRHHIGSQTRFFVSFHIISLGAFFLDAVVIRIIFHFEGIPSCNPSVDAESSWERDTSRSLLLKHSLKNCLEGGDFFRYTEIGRFLAEPNHPAKNPTPVEHPPNWLCLLTVGIPYFHASSVDFESPSNVYSFPGRVERKWGAK